MTGTPTVSWPKRKCWDINTPYRHNMGISSMDEGVSASENLDHLANQTKAAKPTGKRCFVDR